MSILNFLLMSQPGGASANSNSGWIQLAFFGGLFAVMYFFMIRPQTKKANDQKKFSTSLQKGDKLVTMSGIHGKITKVNDTTFDLEIAPNTNITIEKSVVSMEVTKSYYPAK